MTLDQATDVLRQTLLLALVLCAPILAVGLVVGVVASLLQAATQIQEQTLSFIPKIVAMVGVAIMLLPWLCHRLMEFSAAMFGGAARW